MNDHRKLAALSGFALALTLVAFSPPFSSILGGRVSAAKADAPTNAEARQPVLVELFTSEGCSSCPPADALLARLDRTQFVPGAQAIVLSEHVTYWDQLGWRDRFSQEAITERQRAYAARFGLNDVYTPQVVVDGAAELVGGDERGLTAAVERAAHVSKAELAIQDAHWSGDRVEFVVTGQPDAKTELMAALAEDSAQTAVARGENAGHTLTHVAVVTVLQEMGKGSTDGKTLMLMAPHDSAGKAMRLVVFLVDRHNGHVLGVAQKLIGLPAAG
jgi:hypothetical protein